ncbi:MAG: lamin tail domain-containing protein [Methanothrix sp.]
MFLSCLALNTCSFASASESVVINEVELDYIEDDAEIQWVEIYNNGAEEVDLSGWAIMSSDDRSRK